MKIYWIEEVLVMKKCLGAMLVALLVPVSVFAEDATDVFGFQKFYQTKSGT